MAEHFLHRDDEDSTVYVTSGDESSDNDDISYGPGDHYSKKYVGVQTEGKPTLGNFGSNGNIPLKTASDSTPQATKSVQDGSIHEAEKVKTMNEAVAEAAYTSVLECVEDQIEWSEDHIMPKLITMKPFIYMDASLVRRQAINAWTNLKKKAAQGESFLKTVKPEEEIHLIKVQEVLDIELQLVGSKAVRQKKAAEKAASRRKPQQRTQVKKQVKVRAKKRKQATYPRKSAIFDYISSDEDLFGVKSKKEKLEEALPERVTALEKAMKDMANQQQQMFEWLKERLPQKNE